MNKKHKLLIRKFLSLSKLGIGFVLALVIVRTVFILREAGSMSLPNSAAATGHSSALPSTPTARPTVSDYSTIFENNIFGNYIVESDSEEQMHEGSAEEQMGLLLVGTVTGSRTIARAVIKDLKTNAFGLYKIGDTVDGASIEQIEKSSVVLVLDNQEKVLNLYAKKPGHHSGTDTSPIKPIASGQNVTVTEINVTGEHGAKIRARLSDIEKVLETVVIEPHIADGDIEGLKIEGLEDLAAEIGLKNGDIIKAVNNQKLTSTQKAYQVFKKARSQPEMTIELIRDGKPETISFIIR